jgi:hypothetical protein
MNKIPQSLTPIASLPSPTHTPDYKWLKIITKSTFQFVVTEIRKLIAIVFQFTLIAVFPIAHLPVCPAICRTNHCKSCLYMYDQNSRLKVSDRQL